MDQHLNSDQIDELLQSTTGDDPAENANRNHLENARRHLKDCETCQAQMRAHEQVLESLALLKSNTPAAKGPMCPPDGVLLEIAAGNVRQNSRELLSHAAECDHCGPLLREAKEDFADELTPEEEKSIAELSSSTTHWQRRLTVKLQDAQAPLPVFPPPKDRSPSFLGSLLTPWPLAFAAALIGLILFAVRDYRQTAGLLAQNHEATAEIQRLKQSILQQGTQIAQMTTESRRSSLPATPPEPQPTGYMQTASLVLDPLSRGTVRLTRLTIPRRTDFAKITLHSVENSDDVVHADLVARGETKWTKELRPTESEKRTSSLSLLVPVYLLTPGDYLIVLRREPPAGSEGFPTYTFRVTR